MAKTYEQKYILTIDANAAGVQEALEAAAKGGTKAASKTSREFEKSILGQLDVITQNITAQSQMWANVIKASIESGAQGAKFDASGFEESFSKVADSISVKLKQAIKDGLSEIVPETERSFMEAIKEVNKITGKSKGSSATQALKDYFTDNDIVKATQQRLNQARVGLLPGRTAEEKQQLIRMRGKYETYGGFSTQDINGMSLRDLELYFSKMKDVYGMIKSKLFTGKDATDIFGVSMAQLNKTVAPTFERAMERIGELKATPEIQVQPQINVDEFISKIESLLENVVVKIKTEPVVQESTNVGNTNGRDAYTGVQGFLDTAINEQRKNIAAYNAELKSLEGTVKATSLERLNGQLDQQKKSLAELQVALENISGVNGNKKDVKGIRGTLTEGIAYKEEEIARIQSQIEALNAELDKFKDRPVAVFGEEAAAVESRVAELTASIEASQAKIEDYQTRKANVDKYAFPIEDVKRSSSEIQVEIEKITADMNLAKQRGEELANSMISMITKGVKTPAEKGVFDAIGLQAKQAQSQVTEFEQKLLDLRSELEATRKSEQEGLGVNKPSTQTNVGSGQQIKPTAATLNKHLEAVQRITDEEANLFDKVIAKSNELNISISQGVQALSSSLRELKESGLGYRELSKKAEESTPKQRSVRAPVIDEGVEARIKQIRSALDEMTGDGLSDGFKAKLQAAIEEVNKMETSFRNGTMQINVFKSGVDSFAKSLNTMAEAERQAAEAQAEQERLKEEAEQAAIDKAAAEKQAAQDAAEAEKRAAEEAAAAEKKAAEEALNAWIESLTEKATESNKSAKVAYEAHLEALAAEKQAAQEAAEAEKKAAEEAAEAQKKASEEAREAAFKDLEERKRLMDERIEAEKQAQMESIKESLKQQKKERDSQRSILMKEYDPMQKEYVRSLKKLEDARYKTTDNSAGIKEMEAHVEALREKILKAQKALLALGPTPEQKAKIADLAQLEFDIHDQAKRNAMLKWGNGTEINANNVPDLKEAIVQAETLRDLSDIKIEPKFESDALQQFAVSGKNARGEIESMTYTVDKATGEVYRLSNASKQAAQSTMTMGNFFSQAANYLVRYFGMYMSAHRLFSEIRNGVGYVKELDTAMTEFQVVTKETDETLNKFADDAYEVANSVASTTAEVTKSSTEWARLGYNMEDALTLATQSAKLAKTGFMEVSESTEQLTASIQAFYGADLKSGIVSAGEAATHVSDELVALGNQMPITSQGLGAALERSAGSLVAAGNSIEESVALLAAANATIQNPESVGIGFKTVAMRLRGTKVTDLANDSDIDIEGMATSASKLYDKIKKLTAVKSNDFQGISILTDTGAYKSTFQILSEIADVWKEMNDVNQAALLEEIAGKRQAAAIGAIMNDPELLKQGKQYADEAAGATDEAMEIAMDSIESRLAQLKNNWQSFWQDLISSGMAKTIINMINGIVEALDRLIKLGSKFGSLTPLLGLLSGVGVGFHQIRTQNPMFGVLGLGSSIGKAWKNRKFDASGLLSGETNSIMNTAEFQKAGDQQKLLKERLSGVQKQIGMTDDAIEKYTVSVVQNGKETGEAAKEAVNAGGGFKNFGLGLLNTIGTMMAVSVAMAAINWAYKKFDENVIHKYDTAIKKAKEFAESQEEVAKSVENNIKTIDGYEDRFNTLSKGVDEYGNNVSLTAKEFEEYKGIIAQVVEMSPELAKGYDLENGYLVDKIDLLKRAKEAQEAEYKASLKERTNASDGAKTEIDAAIATYRLARQEYAKYAPTQSFGGVKYGNSYAEQMLLNEQMSFDQQYGGLAHLLGYGPEYKAIDTTVAGRLDELYKASQEYADSQKDLAHYLSEDIFHLALPDDYDYSQFFTDYEKQIAATAKTTAGYLTPANDAASDAFEDLQEEVNNSVDAFDSYHKSYDEAARDIKSNLNAVAELTANYSSLNNEYKNLVSAFISGFGPEYFDNGNGELDKEKYHQVSKQINDLVNTLFADTGIQGLIKSLQSDSVSAADYSSAVDSVIAKIQDAMPDSIELSADTIKAELNLVPVDENSGMELSPENMKQFIDDHLDSGGSVDLGSVSMGKLTAMYNVVVELNDENGDDAATKFSKEFVENIAEYNRQKQRIESISHSTFEDAKTSVEAYTTALSTLPKFISNNVTITEDQYKEIVKVVGANKDLNSIIEVSDEQIDGNTAYVVKNSEALNKLLQSNGKVTDAMRKVADGQDQAKKRYAELTAEIYKTITATEGFDQAALNSLYEEAEAIQDLIDDYAKLEQQVLGNTKAFDDFAKAKEVDALDTYAGSIVEMYNAVKEAQKTGARGTETFQVAARSMLPEGWEGDLNNFVAITESSFSHVDQLVKDGMLTIKDDAIQALDINNVMKFIQKGLDTGALTGTIDNFRVATDTVEEFADMMDMSVTEVLAFTEAESHFDVFGRNMAEEWSGNNLSKQIHTANQELMTAMTELNNAYATGDKAIIDAANKNVEDQKAVVDTLADQATEVATRVAPYINDQAKLQSEINEALVAVDNTAEGTYANEKAKNDLSYLLETYQLLQQPIQLEVTIAKEKLEGQIAELDEQIKQAENVGDHAAMSTLTEQRDGLQATLDEINTYVGEDQKELAKVFDVDVLDAANEDVQTILDLVNQIGEDKSIYSNKELKETKSLLDQIANNAIIDTSGVADVKKEQEESLQSVKKTIEEQNKTNDSHKREQARKAYQDKVTKEAEQDRIDQSHKREQARKAYEERIKEELVEASNAAMDASREAEEEAMQEIYAKMAAEHDRKRLVNDVNAERASRRPAPEVPAVDLPEPEVKVTVETEYASEDLETLMSMLQNEQETIDLVVDTEYGGAEGLDAEQLQFIKDISEAQDNVITISTDGDADVKVADIADKLQTVRDNAVTNLQFPENGDIITKLDNIIFKLRTIKKLGADNASASTSASGTSEAFGNSFAGGRNNDLVGELGRELVVDPHAGRYYTVGDNGAEMINLPKDAIVFNHWQTEELLKRGYSSRGKSFVSGNAYAETGGKYGLIPGTGSGGGGGSSSTKAAAEEAAKDWVEAFKKAQQELEKQYKAGEISFEDYLDKMTALYQKYYDQYGSKSKEEMEKLHNAWVEMYNGTQSLLDSQYGDGEISLRQYLNNLQSLYQRFYANTTEYAKERAEAEKNYIKQMKSGYESLFSAANTVIQHQINDLERQKKAADKAYDAQIRAIQSQIDHYEDLIEGIEKQKKAIQKEIDAIRASNEERQRAIDLQKAQYELARAQNQRTQYIYTSDKGFVYRSNPTEEREKREELDNQRTEQRIAELQKEIDKLDETIEKYQEQIDIWNKQIEAIEKMKEATDRYFDDLIEQLQLQQEKWSEFQEMMELAQAISVLESFGLTVQDVLNGTGEGMERIKEGFLTVLATINKGNEEGLVGLSQAFGKSVEEVQGMISDADSMALGVNGLITSLVQNAAGAADPVDAVADSMSKLTGSVKDTAGLKDVADTMSKISGTDATGLTDSLTTLSQNAGQFTALNAELTQLLDTINNLGQNTTFASNGELLAQFQAFCQNFMLQAQTFKDNVTALFGGGGGVAAGAGAEGGGAGGASGGWFDSFVAQVEDLNMRTQGPMAELTAQWQTLKDTIQSIIGSYDEEGGGEEDDSSILGNFAIGSEGLLLALQEWTDSLLNFQSEGIAPVASSITDIINSMADAVIAACSRAAAAINALRGQAVEANIAVTGGGVADGTAHALGTAFVNGSGNWGLRGNERGALVGELGPEAVVRNGKYSILGQNGAEFANLRRGDIVFNHKQTEQLFKYGKITGRGRAFASGSFPSIDGFKPMASALWEKMTNALSSISDNLQRIAPEVQRTGLAFAGAGGGMSSDDHSFVIQNMNIDMPNFNSDKADDLIKDLNTLAIKAVQRYHR